METNEVRKEVFLKTSLDRVWNALTNSSEFSTWFGMAFDGPFVIGQYMEGKISGTKVDPEIAKQQEPYKGKTATWFFEKVEPKSRFVLKWHPFAIDPTYDYSQEPMTTITFTLQPQDGGVLLRVTETGFDKIPASRRADALKANDGGWAAQMQLIKKYLAL